MRDVDKDIFAVFRLNPGFYLAFKSALIHASLGAYVYICRTCIL